MKHFNEELPQQFTSWLHFYNCILAEYKRCGQGQYGPMDEGRIIYMPYGMPEKSGHTNSAAYEVSYIKSKALDYILERIPSKDELYTLNDIICETVRLYPLETWMKIYFTLQEAKKIS